MFCPKCGNQLADSAKFCDKCGAVMPQTNGDSAGGYENMNTQSAPNMQSAQPYMGGAQQSAPSQNGDMIPMVLSLVCAVVMLISPFIKLFNVDYLFGDEDFSPSQMFSIIKDITGEVSEYSDLDGDEQTMMIVSYDEQTIMIVSYVIIIVYAVMAILALASIVKCLQRISASDSGQRAEYFKNAYSANLAVFFANLLFFGVLELINVLVTAELEADSLVQVFTGNTAFFVMEIIGIIGYILARMRYRAYK